MKGKATMTLCDAKSGRVVKRIEEHNMVTNALRSIFQPPKLAMLGGLDFSRSLKDFLPMSKSLIGGLVLLGENVAEDAADFMLKPDYSVIGHAGGAYSGTEATRGTLNENESYALENGYHFTWDFPTDKANGVIRCCALTNKHFGNIGRAPENSDGTIIVNPLTPANSAVSVSDSLATLTGHFVGMYEKGILTFLGTANSELIRTRVKLIDPNSILINDAVGGAVIGEESLSVPFCPTNSSCYFVDSVHRLVYYFNPSFDVSSNITEVSYYGVDPLTGEVAVNGTTTLQGLFSIQLAALFGDRFFQCGNSKLNVFSLSDGAIIESYDFVADNFFVYDGTLCAVGTSGGIRCMMCFSNNGAVFMRNNGNIPVESSFVSLPYTLHTQGAPTTNGAQIMMFTNYLATINNLSQPLEKTSAQTLKVSYDITNS